MLDKGPPPAFHTEASASLARAFDEEHAVENALLELRTLVMGYNAGIDPAREEVTSFLVSRMDMGGGAAKVLLSATRIWERWGPLAAGLSPDLSNIALDVQVRCLVSVLSTNLPCIIGVLRGTSISRTIFWRASSRVVRI